MTITREIDGKQIKIELTDDEVYAAYEVKQFQFDRADMEDYIVGVEEGEDFKEEYGVDYSDAEEHLDELAYKLRRLIDKWDMSWEFAREAALEEWCNEQRNIKNAEDELRHIPLEHVGGEDYEETAE